MFDKFVFKKYQRLFLTLLNLPLFHNLARRIFWVKEIPLKITKITPYSTTYKISEFKFRTIAYGVDQHAQAIKKNFYWIWALFHWFDMTVANRFVPAWNLGFDTLNQDSDAADGNIEGVDASGSYANARNTADNFSIVAATIPVTQSYFSGTTRYILNRGYFKFNTSAIPDGDEITQVNINATPTNVFTGQLEDIFIVDTDWSGTDPITNGNKETPYDNCLSDTPRVVWQNTNDISASTEYASSNLATTWVSKTGFTYYGMIDDRQVNATPPTGANQEGVIVASADHGTAAFRPNIDVIHGTSFTPSLTIS